MTKPKHFDSSASHSQLSAVPIDDLLFMNEKLEAYLPLWEFLDAMIVLDAEWAWAYEWREEAEEALRREGRGAMSESEVRAFVDGYVPAYELYLPGLRDCTLAGEKWKEGKGEGKVLKVRVGRGRECLGSEVL